MNPEFDENGYPTDKTLDRISEWDYKDGYVELMSYVGHAWHWNDFVYCNSIKNSFGDDVWEYTLITGGWSGNEDIVAALRANVMFHVTCWRESHRGGKHIYEVKK